MIYFLTFIKMAKYGIFSPKQVRRKGVSVYEDDKGKKRLVTNVGNFPGVTPKNVFEVLSRGTDDAIFINSPLVKYVRRATKEEVEKALNSEIL